MCELYYYDERTDKFKELGELTTLEFIEAAEEVSAEGEARVWDALEPFEAEITTGPVDLEIRLMFKSWAGIVPRKIGVWA